MGVGQALEHMGDGAGLLGQALARGGGGGTGSLAHGGWGRPSGAGSLASLHIHNINSIIIHWPKIGILGHGIFYVA